MSVLVLTDEASFSSRWCQVFRNLGLNAGEAALGPMGSDGALPVSILFASGKELLGLSPERVESILTSPAVNATYKVVLLTEEQLNRAPSWMGQFHQWCWAHESESVIGRRIQWVFRTEKVRVARTSHTSRLVNHDVNNPLTAIRILSEMLHGDITDATLRTDLDDIMEAADVATATIEAYSTLLKVRSGYQPTFGMSTDLVGIVQEILRRPALRKCTDYLGASGVCVVPIEGSLLRSVLTDILMNARKMVDGRSRIEVGLSVVDSSFVQLTCRSVAIGLPADVRDHLFMDNGAGLLREQRLPVLSVGLHGAWHTVTALGGTLSMADAQDGGLEVICRFPTQSGG